MVVPNFSSNFDVIVEAVSAVFTYATMLTGTFYDLLLIFLVLSLPVVWHLKESIKVAMRYFAEIMQYYTAPKLATMKEIFLVFPQNQKKVGGKVIENGQLLPNLTN